MNNEEFINRNFRTNTLMAAPAAFANEDTVYGNNKGTHLKVGDPSKIYNPRTDRYVNIHGKVGQEVISQFGYPQTEGYTHENSINNTMQSGGYSLTDANDQFSESLADLYGNLKSKWNDLWSFVEDKSKTLDTNNESKKSKKSKKSNRSSVRHLEEDVYPPSFDQSTEPVHHKKRRY